MMYVIYNIKVKFCEKYFATHNLKYQEKHKMFVFKAE